MEISETLTRSGMHKSGEFSESDLHFFRGDGCAFRCGKVKLLDNNSLHRNRAVLGFKHSFGIKDVLSFDAHLYGASLDSDASLKSLHGLSILLA